MSEVDVDRLREVFLESFSDGAAVPEVGASVSVWCEGEELVTLFGGTVEKEGAAWTAETMVPVYSATKAPAAATLLMCSDFCGNDEP